MSTCYRWNFNFLACLCSWGDWYETGFVGHPEDRLSRDEAHYFFNIASNKFCAKYLLEHCPFSVSWFPSYVWVWEHTRGRALVRESHIYNISNSPPQSWPGWQAFPSQQLQFDPWKNRCAQINNFLPSLFFYWKWMHNLYPLLLNTGYPFFCH